MTYARIAGVGSFLPEKVVSNKDLEKIMDTSDEWIQERTGIKRRHIAGEGQTTGSMGLEAAKRAMEMAGVGADEIDLIILGTATPDKVLPELEKFGGTVYQTSLSKDAEAKLQKALDHEHVSAAAEDTLELE